MDAEWNRIAKDYIFELSLKDNKGRQITLLQSWKKIVAIIVQDTKTMIKTKKHYSYNVTTALDKLAKQQNLKILVLSENNLYNLLVEKFCEDAFFKNCENDIEFCEGYDETCEPSDDEEEEDNPWDDYEEGDSDDDNN